MAAGGFGAAFAAKQAVTLKHENEITSNDFYAKAKEKQIQ
jgi:predicted aconitase